MSNVKILLGLFKLPTIFLIFGIILIIVSIVFFVIGFKKKKKKEQEEVKVETPSYTKKLTPKKCPACGASIHYNENDTYVTCEYCHTSFDIENKIIK